MSPDEVKKRVKYIAYRKAIGKPLLVPVGPTAEHLRKLRRVLTLKEIQDATGISYHALSKYTRPGRTTVPAEHEEILLRFPVPVRLDRHQRCTATRRILQGLMAHGFTGEVVAAETGLSWRTLKLWRVGLLDEATPHLTVSPHTFELISKVAHKLEMQDPVDLGIPPSRVKVVQSRARRHGYVPLRYWEWETIGDPAARPEYTGHCGTSAGWEIHRRDRIPLCPPCAEAGDGNPKFSGVKLRAIRERKGYSRRMISDALGMDESTIFYWETGRSRPRRKGRLDDVLTLLDATYQDVCE